jgi:hypothetical protein
MYGFRQGSGEPSVRACRDLLVRLDAKGLVCLPPPIGKVKRSSIARPRMGIDFLLGPTPGWTGNAPDDAVLDVRPIRSEQKGRLLV